MKITSFFRFLAASIIAATVILGAFSCSGNDDEIIKSSEKKILEFSIEAIDATINEPEKKIEITLPASSDVKKLKPSIKTSSKSTISPSSNSEVDFTNPVIYTVTAEDGSTQTYTVTVYVKKYFYLISKVTTLRNDQEVTRATFEYDEKNRLKQYNTYEDSSFESYDFEYNSNGELTKFIVTFSTGEEKVYDLNYKDATTIEASYVEDGVDRIDIFKLNENGLVVRHYEDIDGENAWIDFEYDSKGNVLKTIDDDGGYAIYTYDDKNGMMKDVTLPQWLTFYITGMMKTPNNFTSLTYYEADGTIDYDIQTLTYTYDDAGYPVSCVYDSEEGLNFGIEYKILEE